MNLILVKDIRLPIAESSAAATDFAQKKLSALIGAQNVGQAEVYKKSVDARHKDKISVVWSVAVETEVVPSLEIMQKEGLSEIVSHELTFKLGDKKTDERPVVVGFGPAGMFSALVLAENGYCPIVIERGDDTADRLKAVERFYATGRLDTESNIQFGAGGAGTFSDGKLVTRINDKRCRYVLKRFSDFGAPKEVLTKAKPHVGTDKLVGVVEAIKNEIIRLGGEIRFRTAMVSLNTDSQGEIKSVVTANGEIPCCAVILATGHSARDVYGYLGKSDYSMSEKPLSVGVRIEHLRTEVENALYGRDIMRLAERNENIKELLGSAEYAYSHREPDGAAYTFCMCPGGEVVAGASEEGGVVVNGMSRYARDGRNSNCAVCVSMTPEECKPFGGAMAFIRQIEQRAYQLGGGGYRAPIETVGDFLAERKGAELHQVSVVIPTYMGDNGNYKVADLHTLFPNKVNRLLGTGIKAFGRKMKGFDAPYAILTGAETRTSAPYRIERNEYGTAIGHKNLYPCGEGAGFAGGITSAAVDGIEQAIKLMSVYAPSEK